MILHKLEKVSSYTANTKFVRLIVAKYSLS